MLTRTETRSPFPLTSTATITHDLTPEGGFRSVSQCQRTNMIGDRRGNLRDWPNGLASFSSASSRTVGVPFEPPRDIQGRCQKRWLLLSGRLRHALCPSSQTSRRPARLSMASQPAVVTNTRRCVTHEALLPLGSWWTTMYPTVLAKETTIPSSQLRPQKYSVAQVMEQSHTLRHRPSSRRLELSSPTATQTQPPVIGEPLQTTNKR